MTTRFRSLVVLIAILCGGLVRAEYQPEIGKMHPDFTLPDIETRKPVSLSDFRGKKKKVLLIHFASW